MYPVIISFYHYTFNDNLTRSKHSNSTINVTDIIFTFTYDDRHLVCKLNTTVIQCTVIVLNGDVT